MRTVFVSEPELCPTGWILLRSWLDRVITRLVHGSAATVCVVVAALLLSAGNAKAQLMSLSGKFEIGATGDATYHIPIVVPPGTSGMTPALSLEYSSQGGDGMLGIGWSLGGLPSVVHCPQTITQDGVRGSVKFDINDRYCLGEQRLFAVSGSYGADGTEYRTEIESYSRVLSHGTIGNGPAWFEVHTKSGQVMEFGHTSDSQIIPPSMSTVRSWALSKVYDTKGNYYAVTYANDAAIGRAYPSEIDYTGNGAAGLSPYNKVQFAYAARPDIVPRYQVGSLTENTQRLTDVKTFSGSTLVGDYRLAYQSTGTSRSQINSITLCAGGSSCLPGPSFTWTGRWMIGSITSALGAVTTITYQPLTNSAAYTKDRTSTYPVQDIQNALFVVSRVATSNGIGGVYSSTYTYAGAKLDLSGRGFLGFRQMAAKDIQTNIVQTTNYRQDFPYLGMAASISSALGSTVLNQTTNTYQFSNTSGAVSISSPSGTSAPYRVSVSQGVAHSTDLDGTALPTVTTTYQYDAFGNATQVIASTPDGFSKTTANTFTNDTTNWYLGRLSAATVTSVAP
jgi:hypothetical protein